MQFSRLLKPRLFHFLGPGTKILLHCRMVLLLISNECGLLPGIFNTVDVNGGGGYKINVSGLGSGKVKIRFH